MHTDYKMSPEMRSVLRIVAALLFVQHGSAKLLHVPYQAMFAHLHLMSSGPGPWSVDALIQSGKRKQ